MNKIPHTDRIPADTQFTLVPTSDEAGLRLDKFLSNRFVHYSRSFFQDLILHKLITMRGTLVTKPSTPVQEGDTIIAQFPPERPAPSAQLLESDLGVEPIHIHEHFLILYKPAKLLVHPPTEYSKTVSLIDWLTHHYKEIAHVGYIDRPGIVHRLDKDTSGVMVIPRTNYAHMEFGKKFKERSMHKTYYAVVQGHPPREGVIDLPTGRDPAYKARMKAFEKGTVSKAGGPVVRSALTYYTVLEYFDDAALLELKPVTGRTHQIRVHCAAIGHPIVGDSLYGTPSSLIDRHALHAQRLAFEFDGKEYDFSHPMPEDMQYLLTQLQSHKKT